MSDLPELSDKEERMIKFTRTFTVLPFAAMVLTIIGVMSLSIILDMPNEVDLARISLIIAVVFVNLFFPLAWGCGNLMKPRPASHELPEGSFILTEGFRQIIRTSINIYKNYRAIMYFLIAIALGDSAVAAMASIIVTMMADLLQFSSTEVGIASLIAIFCSIPGGFLSAWCTSRFNPIRSSMGAVALLLLTTLATAGAVSGFEQKLVSFFFIALMGVGGGWKQACDRMLISQIIPRGQEAELMGLYLFSNQVLSWLPPLIFTSMNEAGLSQQLGLCSLGAFYFFSLCAYLMMGDFHTAVTLARGSPSILPSDKVDGGSADLCEPTTLDDAKNKPVVAMEGRLFDTELDC